MVVLGLVYLHCVRIAVILMGLMVLIVLCGSCMLIAQLFDAIFDFCLSDLWLLILLVVKLDCYYALMWLLEAIRFGYVEESPVCGLMN